MQPYVHRQRVARWMDLILGFVVAVEIAVGLPFAIGPACWVPWIALAIVAAAWWMVSVLITRVDASGVAWSFTWGWPGGQIPIRSDRARGAGQAESAGARRRRLPLDDLAWLALECRRLSMRSRFLRRDGARVTLGTDDPQGLAQAIERFRRGAA